MKGFTMIDMNELIEGITLSKVCSVKPYKESDESKQITIKVKFDGVKLSSVFEKALAGVVIQVQNGRLRKEFDTLKNGQDIDVQFNAPAKTTVDPETAMIAKLAAMTVEERQEYFKNMMAKASKKA